MDDKTLRILARAAKIIHGLPFSAMADGIGIRRSSFYNWLKGQYDFSEERREMLVAFLTE